MSDPRLFLPHPRYRILTVSWLALSLLFIWSSRSGFSPETALFTLVSLALTLLNLRWLMGKVALTATGFSVHVPLSPSQRVDFRQLISVSEEGRLSRSIAVVYFPVAPDGLLELDAPRTLMLPVLTDQSRLLALMRQGMP